MDGKTKDKRKEADKEKTVGEEQRGEGDLPEGLTGRDGGTVRVRATNKRSIFKCAYAGPSRFRCCICMSRCVRR
jgi:hypothetical protein